MSTRLERMYSRLLLFQLDVIGTNVPDSVAFLGSWPTCGYSKKLNDPSSLWTTGKFATRMSGASTLSRVLRAACFKGITAETNLR
jgi:hypothetical protein